MSAVYQIEYLKQAESKVANKCAFACVKDWAQDDFSQNEQLCLTNCQDKLMTFYEAFYTQTSVLMKKAAQSKLNQ